MLTEQQQQEVSAGMYSVGNRELGRWFARMLELENRVQALEAMIFHLQAQRQE